MSRNVVEIRRNKKISFQNGLTDSENDSINFWRGILFTIALKRGLSRNKTVIHTFNHSKRDIKVHSNQRVRVRCVHSPWGTNLIYKLVVSRNTQQLVVVASPKSEDILTWNDRFARLLDRTSCKWILEETKWRSWSRSVGRGFACEFPLTTRCEFARCPRVQISRSLRTFVSHARTLTIVLCIVLICYRLSRTFARVAFYLAFARLKNIASLTRFLSSSIVIEQNFRSRNVSAARGKNTVGVLQFQKIRRT